MNYLLTIPKNKNISYIDKIDGIIIGLKDFSIGISLELNIDEIKDIRNKYNDKKLFVVINKNLENRDIPIIEDYLIKLDKINIDGVLFYDLAILSLHNKHNLSFDLVWNQTHMVTNYNTCNYYYNEGVKYAYMSLEITVEEIKEIKEKSKVLPMIYVFGRNKVAFSKRKLITNYYKHYDKNKKNNYLEICEKASNKSYIVNESKLGTEIVDKNILNGINAVYDLKDYKDNYFILDEVVDNDIFLKVIERYRQVLLDKNGINREKNVNLLKELVDSDYEGFFYKKTVYKVKKDE